MPKSQLTERGRKILTVLGVALFVLFLILVSFLIGRPLITYFAEPQRFRAWVDAHGIAGRLLFVLMVVLQMLIALIPGEPLEIGAGYAFGVFEGTLLCMAGIAIGSYLIFAFVRRFGVRAVEIFFSRNKIRSMRFLQNSQRLNVLTFIVMLLPGTPKDLLSYFIGLTEMKCTTWLLISIFARIPSVVSSAVSGAALGDGNPILALIALAVTAALSLIGLGIYQLLRQRPEKTPQTPE